MIDGCGRSIEYLRVSITDRCNLRCTYCMPAQGVEWLSHSDILSYEELLRLCKLFASVGIKKIRLTGGEPLVRKGLPDLIAGIKAIDGIQSVTLTTNGVLLAEQLPDLLAAGLNGVNISLDTLNPAQFAAITRFDKLDSTLAGLHAAMAQSHRLAVKVNCVPSGENDSQLVPLASLARDNPIAVRFIEMMPIGMGDVSSGRTQEQVLSLLTPAFGTATPYAHAMGAGPGQYVTFPGFAGKVGFISAMTHQFCHDCNRVRLTATGYMKTCLQYDTGVDLKALLSQEDDAVLEAIRHGILQKPTCHHFAQGTSTADDSRNMFQIGG